MAEELNVARIRNTLDFLDVKITALNRGFIMMLNILQNEGIVNENMISWIDKIKRDAILAKAIDAEKLMEKALDLAPKMPCPENNEQAIALLRKHIPKPKIQKLKLPKL